MPQSPSLEPGTSRMKVRGGAAGPCSIPIGAPIRWHSEVSTASRAAGMPRRFIDGRNVPRAPCRPMTSDRRAAPVAEGGIDRRRFLVLAGSAVAWCALQPPLTASRAWARRGAPAVLPRQPWALPAELPGGTLDQARALIGAAVLAPSHWNTQPWRFEVEGESVRL